MSVKWVRLHYHPVDTLIHIMSTLCSANSRGKSVKGKSSFSCSVGRNKGMSGRNLIRSWFNLCLPWCCSLCSPFRESPEMSVFSLFSSHSHTQSQHNCITSLLMSCWLFSVNLGELYFKITMSNDSTRHFLMRPIVLTWKLAESFRICFHDVVWRVAVQ